MADIRLYYYDGGAVLKKFSSIKRFHQFYSKKDIEEYVEKLSERKPHWKKQQFVFIEYFMGRSKIIKVIGPN